MRTKGLYLVFLFQAFIFNLANVITPDYVSNMGLTKYHFGYFIALWSFGMMISSPVWGTLGDRYGKKRFVIVGLVIYGLSQAVFYYNQNVYFLFLLRIISGIGVGAPVTLLLSYLISNTKEVEVSLSRRMAYLTIGSTISYKVAGDISRYVTNELFLMQSVCTVFLIVIILFIMKEDKHPHCVIPKQYNMFNSIKHMKMLNTRNTMFLIAITLTTMTFMNIDKFLDVLLIDQGYGTVVLGNTKMVFGLVTIIVNFVLIPRLKHYLGNLYVLQTAEIIMAIIVLMTFHDHQLIVMLYTIFLGYVVLRAIFTTSEQLYLSNQVDKSELGLFMGLRQSFTCLGMLIGPIIGGHIYAENPINLFIFCVICLLLSSVILSVIKSPESFHKNTLEKVV